MQQNDGLYHPSSNGTSIKDILEDKNVANNSTVVTKNQTSNTMNTPSSVPDESQPKMIASSHPWNVPRFDIGRTHNSTTMLETTEEPFTESHDSNIAQNSQNKTNLGFVIIEPLLLLTIYIILSQPAVISFIASYIKQLNTMDDEMPFSGILIYGIILTISFLILRKIIFQRMQ